MHSEIKDFLIRHFAIKADQVSVLVGYGSENYKIETSDSTFVLKFYDPDDEPYKKELLEAENLLLQQLDPDKRISHPIPRKNSEGEYLGFSDSRGRFFRLITFVEGDLLSKVEHTPEILYSLGKFLGKLDKNLLSFRHIAIEARKCEWDLQYFPLNRRHVEFIEDTRIRSLVEYFFMQFDERVKPKLETLRKSMIHGDPNDWNLFVSNGEVSGIIDFADFAYSPLINDLAIAVTYGVFGKNDLVGAALPIVEGYHNALPLEEKEIEHLYYLIAARTCISICHAARSKHEGRDSEYVLNSLEPALDLIERWVRINPLVFENELRKAVGFESKLQDSDELALAKREKHTSKAVSLQFSEPIKMVGAAFQYMYDASGKTYLDCYNNIPQVGHCHPRVVRAGQKAMARLNTNTRYLSDVYNKYADNLLAKLPESLAKVFFVNSGSAASDLAIRLAMTHTQKKGIVVVEHGYHGNTRLGIDISHYKYNRSGGNGKQQVIVEAEIPDTYKGRFELNDGTAGRKYADAAKATIRENALPIAAFIAEPIVGCGGQVPLAKGYLKEMYPFVREQGGVCISDEVQTGFGRLGKCFWGFEMQDVIPDIVVLGKPMGNGHPMAAVVTTDEIATSFETGMEFFSSFGGNPVSCLIGQSVLDVLEEERLPENAREVGGYLLGLFDKLVAKYEVCGDARGEGLFLGLELVKDKSRKEPNTELASIVQNRLKEKGIMVGTDGPFVNVIKIKPPICFTKENADELAGSIGEIISDL